MHGAESAVGGQKRVNWREWSNETFKLAQELDKPILLDIGAVWCHWCHVMEEQCYANPEIIDIINEHFIAIQVDNDKRPDINERYNMGGWPTTAFLLPTGEFMLFRDSEGNIIRVGGTFFPPEQFKGLLLSVSNFYKENKEGLFSLSKLAAQAHKDLHEIPVASDAEVTASMVDEMAQAVVSAFDETDAGFWFGRGNKFPQPAAIELVLMKYQSTGDKKWLDYATRTLDAMASGGMYDHLWGGFHRYSVTPDWRIPHFEKMSMDNALILQNYLHAYQVTGKEYYKKVAEETVGYVNSVMSDQVNGGFYGSQDADVGPDDDGSYFTWSEKQVRDLLSQKEAEVIIKYFGINDNRNAMREHPEQHVLNISYPPEADERKSEELIHLMRTAMEKMCQARAKIKAPFVDKTVYTDWNAMMISSFLDASVVLNPPIPPLIKGGKGGFKEFALKTIDFLLEHCYEKGRGMYHYYDGKPHVTGLLTDQANMANCLIDAYQVTGDNRYLEISQELVEFMVENFIDEEGGGFFDTAEVSNAPGALQERVKNIETNAVASNVLMKLYYLLGDEKYKKWARSTILTFSGQLKNYGFLASRFGSAINRFLSYPLQITVVGSLDDKRSKALVEAGLKFYEPGKIVELLDPKRDKLRIEKRKYPITDIPTAYVCIGTRCIEPVQKADKLSSELKAFVKKGL